MYIRDDCGCEFIVDGFKPTEMIYYCDEHRKPSATEWTNLEGQCVNIQGQIIKEK